jgi:MFS transporter, DHA2 family, multidrug resistance protein
MTETYPEPAVRRLITASVLAATLMSSIDTTIANVALPHIQGSVSASAEEISWVLTSYLVASAICTPLAGYLAGRIGRRRVIIVSVIGFTIASGLCGVANSLVEIVGFRFLQGIFGAALVPMGQATLLDLNPPEKHGSAMSVWSMAAIVGPIIGPTLGGWLTDNLTWRWVFFINLPVGIATFAGLVLFLPESKAAERKRFDLFGYASLALAIASLQVMLDRGQTKDWFDSLEICLECGAAAFFGWCFIVQTLTADQPFVPPQIFADRNFLIASVLTFLVGIVLYSVLALLPPLFETLMGYSVVLTGLVTAPRGISSMIAMMFAGPLMRRFDPRILIGTGFVFLNLSMRQMTGFSLGMSQHLVIVSGLIQGAGTGLIMVALSTVAFGTLERRYRNEGAAMFTLLRNTGSAAGIAIIQTVTVRNAAKAHARLIEGVRPDNPILTWAQPDFDFDSAKAVARLNAEIARQASMVAYVDSFSFLLILTGAVIPLVFLIRKARPANKPQIEAE